MKLLFTVWFVVCLTVTGARAENSGWLNLSQAKSYLRKIRNENKRPTKVTCREGIGKKMSDFAEMRFVIVANDEGRQWMFLTNAKNMRVVTWRKLYEIKDMKIESYSQFRRAKSGAKLHCIIGISP